MPKIALVTGCSTGLGRALALRLASETHGDGYTVYATARNVASVKELAAQDNIKTLQLDVTSQASVDAAVGAVMKEAGRIDLLVNNAGLSRAGPLVEQPLAEIEEVLNTNVVGVLRVTQAVAPHMAARRSGHIVLIGSVTQWLSTPFGGAYCASKAAVGSLADTLRLELQPFGVGVTLVVAGSIKSSIADNIEAGSEFGRYEAPGALYRPFAADIKKRAQISQRDKNLMTAEQAADHVVGIANASLLPGAPPPAASGALARALGGVCSAWRRPNWFLTGGSAVKYFLLGYVQKVLPQGWPVNGIVAKTFGVHRLLPPPSS